MKGKNVTVSQWIEGRAAGSNLVLLVEAPAVLPDADPSEPCFEPDVLRALDELKRLADAGNIDELRKAGRVYTQPAPVYLGDEGGDRLGLAILGYEFPTLRPHIHDNTDDLNWLMICGHVECRRGSWMFRHPCLFTWELADLLAWLEAFPNPPTPTIRFTEPLLEFSISASGSAPPLSIRLAHEALPAGQFDRNTRIGTGVILSPRTDSELIARFTADMRKQAEAFPARRFTHGA